MKTDRHTTTPAEHDHITMRMPTGATNPSSTDIPERQFGIIIWLMIGVLALLLIGLFLWYQTLQSPTTPTLIDATRPTAAENQEPESQRAVADVTSFATMSNSDNLDTIAADLESTPLDSLAAEMTAIETELGIDQ